jgi:Predicted nucleotidyltransferase
MFTNKQLLELCTSPEYDFLRTDENLKNQILFLTLGGSHAYGTNIEGSDVDIRGCVMSRREVILGLSQFEQVVERQTDTVIYSINKLFPLLLNCNPACIEMLGNRPEHYIHVHPAGQKLIDNRKLFLSQKAVNSFGGYAHQQLSRIKAALNEGAPSQEEAEEGIRASIERAIVTFSDRYKAVGENAIKVYLEVSENPDLEQELFANINLQKYPLRDYLGMFSEMQSIIARFNKLNHRNKKKAGRLNKHAMHLVRLLLESRDLFETGDIVTHRDNDLDLLMSIRNGTYETADGKLTPEFFELVDELAASLDYAKKHTALPEKPDVKAAEELLIYINEQSLQKVDEEERDNV